MSAAHPTDAEMRKVVGAARLAYFTPVHHQPPLADRKAAFLLAATGVILTVLLIFSDKIAGLVRSPSPVASSLVLIVLFAMIGAMAIGAYYSWCAFSLRIPPMPRSPAFFTDIAKLTLDDYRDEVKGLDHQAAIRAILHYNYSLATQGAIKFRLVGRAFACFRVVIVLWMFILLMISLAG